MKISLLICSSLPQARPRWTIVVMCRFLHIPVQVVHHMNQWPLSLFSGSTSEAAVPRADADHLPSREGTTPVETRYSKRYGLCTIAHCTTLVYYQIHKQKRGAVLSKRPADSNDSYVGRISVDFIPPPHTAASIMRYISNIEELDGTRESQLFTSISGKSPIEGHVSILTIDRPGSTPEDPMAFVQLAPLHIQYPKQIRVCIAPRRFSGDGNRNPNWLTTAGGEILRTTNEGPSTQPWNSQGNVCHISAYRAINNAGKVG